LWTRWRIAEAVRADRIQCVESSQTAFIFVGFPGLIHG